MIFSVQRFLEDHLAQRGLSDVDQYAVRLANAFEEVGTSASARVVCSRFARVRTSFFKRNRELSRKVFEQELVGALLRRFQKKKPDPELAQFHSGLVHIRATLFQRP